MRMHGVNNSDLKDGSAVNFQSTCPRNVGVIAKSPSQIMYPRYFSCSENRAPQVGCFIRAALNFPFCVPLFPPSLVVYAWGGVYFCLAQKIGICCGVLFGKSSFIFDEGRG